MKLGHYMYGNCVKREQNLQSIKDFFFATIIFFCSINITNAANMWSFEENFKSNPQAPSQNDLPRNFEYVVTHRTHPQEHFTKQFDPFLADHSGDCTGPNPEIVPLPQHEIQTKQDSNSERIDQSFFICRNHMMSSMGEVAAYSNTVFWPRQEFDFSNGGTLEFEVNINEGHTQRHWWEVLISPRSHMKFASAPRQSAVDEAYPRDRIVLDFRDLVRQIRVGKDQLAPNGWLVEDRQFAEYDFAYWRTLQPDDPALDDRRIRRIMRIRFTNDSIIWGIEKENGEFDDFTVTVPGGMPFNRGIVQFKTHAYTPAGSGNNFSTYTFHWDNIRFTGPNLAPYKAYHAQDVIYLQRNGSRPIGDSQTTTINIEGEINNPILLGQIHGALKGQPLVSINGSQYMNVDVDDYLVEGCVSGQWRDWISFRLPLESNILHQGENTLDWKVGPRPNCAADNDWWDGFSAKFIHIQADGPILSDSIFENGFE